MPNICGNIKVFGKNIEMCQDWDQVNDGKVLIFIDNIFMK